MNTRMDADTSDDPEHATEEPAAADTPAEAEAESTADDDADDGEEFDHLDSLSDGVGCTEIWEHLSENRDEK